MSSSVHVVSFEPGSGRTLVTLGLVELLAERVGRVGYLRPVGPLPDDGRAELVASRLGPAGEPDDVRTLVEEHGWNRLVLVGPAHERDVVAKDLDGVSGLQVLQLKQVVGGAAHEVLDQVHRVISEAHREYEHDLVRRAVDAALSGGTGAVGPVDVARALTEGRVHHLLLSPDVDAAGLVDGDVLMAADDPRASGLLNDPRFVHRMIERALATDAAVTPVEGPAAELLDEHGELAALLRW